MARPSLTATLLNAAARGIDDHYGEGLRLAHLDGRKFVEKYFLKLFERFPTRDGAVSKDAVIGLIRQVCEVGK